MALFVTPSHSAYIVSTKVPVKEATYRLIDFFTLELVLLASLVLLALVVLIARKSRTG